VATTQLHKDTAIEIMLEYVYEEETSRKGWDSSFIESVRNNYYANGGLTDRQLQIVRQRYEKMHEGNGYGQKENY
jgi:hypothetical protein